MLTDVARFRLGRRLPVGFAVWADGYRVDSRSRQVPGLVVVVGSDVQLGAVAEGQMEGTLAADLNAGDGLAEQVQDGRQAGAGTGVKFVPFPVRVAEQERSFDGQFGVDSVALVGVERGEAEPNLVVEGRASTRQPINGVGTLIGPILIQVPVGVLRWRGGSGLRTLNLAIGLVVVVDAEGGVGVFDGDGSTGVADADMDFLAGDD
ncbi:hypothetical protein MED01_005054 [Micromonospora sp. MED01]|nr:hypothetical protein [Micromonospora alfalfae]MCG5466238.1 hypothetical protein [Micromonospora alfalfae]